MAKIFKAGIPSDREVSNFSIDEFQENNDLVAEAESEEEELDPETIREAVLAEAREEARIKVQEAYEKGLEHGHETGEAQFRESIAESAQCLTSAAEAMRNAREQFIDSLETEVLETVKLIAYKVLEREIRTDPNLICSAIRRALAVLTDRQHLKVHINPVDLDALNTHKVSLLHDFSGIDSFEVEANPTVSPGGCVVSSETMEADAQIETLLAEVINALEE